MSAQDHTYVHLHGEHAVIGELIDPGGAFQPSAVVDFGMLQLFLPFTGRRAAIYMRKLAAAVADSAARLDAVTPETTVQHAYIDACGLCGQCGDPASAALHGDERATVAQPGCDLADFDIPF